VVGRRHDAAGKVPVGGAECRYGSPVPERKIDSLIRLFGLADLVQPTSFERDPGRRSAHLDIAVAWLDAAPYDVGPLLDH
jgi:hypothetical protein